MRNHSVLRAFAAGLVCLQTVCGFGTSALAAGTDKELAVMTKTGYGPAYDALVTDLDRSAYEAFYWSAAHENAYADVVVAEDIEDYRDGFRAFRSDFPEYWYATTYKLRRVSSDRYAVCIVSRFTDSEIESWSDEIDAITDEVASEAAAYTDDADKAAYVADWICAWAEYKRDGDGLQQYVPTLLLQKYGVCEAYARVYDLIMKKAGIPCITVIGSMNGSDHAWNEVELDGKWYAVDTTWMDSIYGDTYLFMSNEVYEQEERTTYGDISYPVFCDWTGEKR